ncbi:MAG: hypothetical protein ACFFCD_07895 [Promethearchaeota archaeon]
MSKNEISKTVYEFYEEYRSTLKRDIKHDDISQVLKEIEEFRPYKVELLKVLKSDNRVDALIDMVHTLSKRGHSKEAIYDIFTTLYSYVQYKYDVGAPEFNEYDADLIADAILDGLWGGGWDKGNRLLPDEPDVADKWRMQK